MTGFTRSNYEEEYFDEFFRVVPATNAWGDLQ